MTTAAERLVSLAGQSGAAGALLLAIGAGATAGEALADYSGLPTATAAVHLMTDVAVSGGFKMDYGYLPNRKKKQDAPEVIADDEDELEMLLLTL
jgi:hypothetical protein